MIELIGSASAPVQIHVPGRRIATDLSSNSTNIILQADELTKLILDNSNDLRKIVSICAKLEFMSWHNTYSRWQELRDKSLFTKDSKLALNFHSRPLSIDRRRLNLVTGKSLAEQLRLLEGAQPIVLGKKTFLWQKSTQALVTPYFDYRQLPNREIYLLSTWLAKHII